MSKKNVNDEKKINSNEKLNSEIISNENVEEDERQFVLNNTKLDDFFFLGKYTLFVCIFSELMILCQLGNMLYMSYAGIVPNVLSCGTDFDAKNISLKKTCEYVEKIRKNNSNLNCLLDAQFESIGKEFNYYCSDSFKIKQSISYQMIGLIIGSAIFGNLSDMFGRRKIMLISLVLCLIFMIATSFSNNLTVFTVLRFFVCVFNSGTIVILMVFIVENLPKKDRFWISNIVTWSPNMILFAGIAYLSNNWRTLTRVSAILGIPCVVVLIYLCESPQFLVHNRQIDAAREAIARMYRISGRTHDEELLNHVLNKEEQTFLNSKNQKNYNFFSLFSSLTLTRYTIAISFSFIIRFLALSVIGICSLLYTTNGIASNELFPTCVRNISYSCGQIFTRIGVVLAPMIFELKHIWKEMPFLLMFIIAILDFFIFQFNVIETKGRPLTDNMPQSKFSFKYKNKHENNIELLQRTKTSTK